MERYLVSIIVPVYNSKKYLRECIESLIEQTYKKIEIILVDDGSSDGSSIICDEYAKIDKRIIVHHQENGGVVCARKRGILSSRGEYICFVDADDTAKSEMVEFLVGNIKDFDLITTGVEHIDKNGNTNVYVDAVPQGDYESEEQMKYLISNMITYQNRNSNGLLPYMYGKLYRTCIARNIAEELDETGIWI